MRERKYHLYLSSSECQSVLQNLIWFRENLHRRGRYTDAVDDLILKFSKAKGKKI